MATQPGKAQIQKTKASVSFPPEIMAIIERLAKNDGRKVAGMIRKLTMEALESRGRLKED